MKQVLASLGPSTLHWMMLVPAVSWKLGPSTQEVAGSLEIAHDEPMLVGLCAID